MTKPSKNTKSGRRSKAAKRKQAARKPVDVVTAAEPPVPVEPAPQPNVEELQQEIAAFDHDGDGHVGGSLPHSAEQGPDADSPADAEVVEEAPADPAPEAEEPETESAAAAPFDKCMVGPVEARVGRVPLGAVLGLLDPDGLRRIEAEKSTASFEDTCKRLLATDGQATPVVFAQTYDKRDRPSILHGYQELAAAEASGANEVTVILIPPGGASEAQSHIVEMVRQQRMKAQPTNDDELFYRVHAEG